MRKILLLLGLTLPCLAAAQRESAPGLATTPVVPNSEVNARFDRLRNLNMELAARWPNNPFHNTAQGEPTLVTAQDISAPPAARNQFNKAVQALQHGEGAKAVERFQKALALDANFVAAYNNLGVAYMYMGDHAQAQAALQKAVQLDQHGAVPFLNLCRVSLVTHDFDQAESFAEKAAELEAGPASLTLLALTKLLNKKYDQAISDGRRVHAFKHEGYAIAHFVTASALQSTGNTEDAIVEYRLFVKEDPQNPRTEMARQAIRELENSRPAQTR